MGAWQIWRPVFGYIYPILNHVNSLIPNFKACLQHGLALAMEGTEEVNLVTRALEINDSRPTRPRPLKSSSLL